MHGSGSEAGKKSFKQHMHCVERHCMFLQHLKRSKVVPFLP